MLVLSRRESEKILFPSLGISVEVVKVQGRKTRLGINAPADIPVLRHECAEKPVTLKKSLSGNKSIEFTPDLFKSNQRLGELMQIIRDRLANAAVTLNQLSQSVDEAEKTDSQQFMLELFQELRTLESEANHVLEGSGVAINDPTQALLVEDGPCERKLLEAYLELSGFEVIVAKDGQDALDYLSMHSQPDIVLLDMMMPRVDGPTFVQEIRSNPQLNGMSIFGVSSNSQEEIEHLSGAIQVDRWFKKPISPKDLVQEIAQHLTSKALVA